MDKYCSLSYSIATVLCAVLCVSFSALLCIECVAGGLHSMQTVHFKANFVCSMSVVYVWMR